MPTMIDLDRIQQILTTLDENINGYLMLRYVKKGTVHQLYGPHDPTRDMELAIFTATDNFSAGDTFTVDGVAYSASSENGKALTSSQFVTGASVQIVINNKLNHITFKSGSGVGGVDSSQLSQATATASDVLSGKTFYAGNNSLKTGTRSTGDLRVKSGYEYHISASDFPYSIWVGFPPQYVFWAIQATSTGLNSYYDSYINGRYPDLHIVHWISSAADGNYLNLTLDGASQLTYIDLWWYVFG